VHAGGDDRQPLAGLSVDLTDEKEQYCGVTRQISTQTLDNFLTRLEQGYSKFENPYHNLIHAADVTQTTYHLFSQSGLVVSRFVPCDRFGYVVLERQTPL